MNAVYFLEKDNCCYYKTDTFWSISKVIEYAKVHTNELNDQERFLNSLKASLLYKNGTYTNDEGCIKYGYKTIKYVNNKIVPINTVYLKCTEYVNGLVEWVDYKVKLRNEKIDNLLKN